MHPAAASSPPAAPPRERVYVSNETAGTVAVIDPATGAVEAAIPVGKRPRGLKVSRDGKTLYVALSGSPIAPPGVDESTLPPADRSADGIAVVDVATRKTVRTIHSGQDPEAFDLSPDGKWLYVSNEETAEMSVVDLQAATVVKRVPVGEEPEGVTVSPDGKVVYVTCEGDHTVRAIDTATFAAARQHRRRPAAALDRGDPGRQDAVRHRRKLRLDFDRRHRDAHRHRQGHAAQGRRRADAAAADGRGAVAGREDAVRLERPREERLGHRRRGAHADAARINDVGQRPWGIGIDAAGAKLFTANGPAGDVSIVDVATGAVERRISLGGSPWGIAVATRRRSRHRDARLVSP